MALLQYVKKAGKTVTALQLTMDIEELRYQKWGASQHAKTGDWLVQNDGETYTVDQTSFANTYKALGNGEFIKVGVVWAERAEEAGKIHTKEGASDYSAGDYLVYNDANRTDGYAVSSDKFHQLYQELSAAMNEKPTASVTTTRSSQIKVEEYLQTRVNDQIAWYEKKAATNQNSYKRMQVASIVCGAAIPVLTVFGGDVVIRALIASLGGCVAVVSTITSLYKFETNWVKYRTAAQLLTREKILFLTSTTPYSNDEAFSLFVQNCEAIMAAENSQWSQMFSAKRDKDATLALAENDE